MTGTTKQKTNLPEALPILPLQSVVLLPHARLPLNIFEPRYITLVEDALAQDRMIGLIQPSGEPSLHTPTPLYTVGCAGRIISFVETEDHRFLITLQGVCRFEVGGEDSSKKVYRVVKPDWKNFVNDLTGYNKDSEIDQTRLSAVLRTYFKQLGVNADWDIVLKANNDELISSLIMLCPLQPNEKQALLEAPTPLERAKTLISLLEMACLNKNTHDKPRH